MDRLNKKITLYLIDGLPRGLRSVRVDQWVGKAVAAPRGSGKNIDFTEIAGSASLYFLIGPNDNGLPDIYVGETDAFSNRLAQHDYKKDWWQELVVFFSLDKSLTKTGARYLEKETINRLRQAGKCNLMNGNSGTDTVVPVEDVAGLEEFYVNMALTLPILGYDIFERYAMNLPDKQQGQQVNQASIVVYCEAKGVRAEGLLLPDGKILVKKGSIAALQNKHSFNVHNYNNLKNKLLEIGRLREDGGSLIFTDDYEFNSPSAAAAVVLGRSAAGPREWKDSRGIQLGELQNS